MTNRPDQLLVEYNPGIDPDPCSESAHRRAHQAIEKAITILNSAKNAFVSYGKAQENWRANGGEPRVLCKHCDRDGTNETGDTFWIYLLDPNRNHDRPTGYGPGAAGDFGGHPNVNQHAVIGYRIGLSADGTKDVMVAVTVTPDMRIGTTVGSVEDDYRNYKPGWALMDGEENSVDNGGSGYDKMLWVANGDKYKFAGAGGGFTNGVFTKAGAPDGNIIDPGPHTHTQPTEHPHAHQVAPRATGGGSREVDIDVEGNSIGVGRVDDGDCTTGAKVIEEGVNNCEADTDLPHSNTGATDTEPKHFYEWKLERIDNSMEGLANQATSEVTYSPVTANDDDAYWSTDAAPDVDPPDNWAGTALIVGDSAGDSAHTYILFRGLAIPAGATINTAYLRLQANATAVLTDDMVIRIKAVDADDVQSSELDTAAECDAISKTTAFVDWTISTGEWAVDTDYLSPSITAVIQEVVDRGGWAANQAIAITLLHQSSAGSETVQAKSANHADNNPTPLQRLEVSWH